MKADGVSRSMSPSLNVDEDPCPSLKIAGRERILSYLVFYSVEVISGLDVAHPHWEGQSTLLSLLILI